MRTAATALAAAAVFAVPAAAQNAPPASTPPCDEVGRSLEKYVGERISLQGTLHSVEIVRGVIVLTFQCVMDGGEPVVGGEFGVFFVPPNAPTPDWSPRDSVINVIGTVREPEFAQLIGGRRIPYLQDAVLRSEPRPPATAAQHTEEDAQQALRREIEALNRQMEEAFNRGDLRAVARFYADDGRVVGPGGMDVRGRAALDEYWTGIRQPRSWKLDVLTVDGTRDMAWQLGRSTLVAGPEGSPPSVVDFLLVWKRQPDGALKIQVDFYHSAASR